MTIIDHAFTIITDSGDISTRLRKNKHSSSKILYSFPYTIEMRKEREDQLENELENNLNSLQNLLQEVDVNQVLEKDFTLLSYAAYCGLLDVVKYLVEEKAANVNQIGANGASPLLAAAHEHKDIVLYLIKKGAKINYADKNGKTPLHVAVNYLQTFPKKESCERIGPSEQIDIIRIL